MNKKQTLLGAITCVLALACIVVAYVVNSQRPPHTDAAWYIYVLYIVGSILLLLSTYLFYKLYTEAKGIKGKFGVKEMTFISVQSAITIVLYYFAKFKLPIFPAWLDVQVSEIPALITSFMYGPGAGCLIILIRYIIKLPGTATAGVGELSDLILGVALCIIAGLYYKKHKTLKGAFTGSVIAVLSCTVLACFTNWLIMIPAYTKIAGYPLPALVGMMPDFLNVTTENFMAFYIFTGVIPFNLFRYVLVLILTFVLYKRISVLIKGKREVQEA